MEGLESLGKDSGFQCSVLVCFKPGRNRLHRELCDFEQVT